LLITQEVVDRLSLAANHSMLVLIRIMIPILQFLMKILPFQHTNANSTYFVGLVALLWHYRQEGHPACKKTWCWFVGGNDL